MNISIVILTYNRPDMIEINLGSLPQDSEIDLEVIVVDNSTDDRTSELVQRDFTYVKYIRNPINMGVAGRNVGMEAAHGDIIVTLDDDVRGLTANDLKFIASEFARDQQLGALCFRVLNQDTDQVCNWCHHRKAEIDALNRFPTYEISEGAVAFRHSALRQSGLYCIDFFISHEGKDLAYRIMNAGYSVEYDGRISVRHYHAISGRADWRRYYYDTRNSIWLAVRNMPVRAAAPFLFVTLLSMGIYSIRDGFWTTHLTGIRDGILGIPAMLQSRQSWTDATEARCRVIDRDRPSFAYMVRTRLFRRGVQI